MRSWLFVPADSEKKIDKALSGKADVVILDLEDSVAPANKQIARQIAAGTLKTRNSASPLVYIRVNALDSQMTADDLEAIITARPDGIMLPKSINGGHVEQLAQMMREAIPIIAITTETAASLFNLGTYGNLDADLVAMSWGAEDLSSDLGASSSRTETGELTGPYKLARSLCLIGACAANVQPVDTVYVDFRNDEGLKQECEAAARDGFTGKLAIHPAQIDIINKAFTPNRQQVDEAQSIIDGFAASPGLGVISIGGKMYDKPHLIRAERLMQRANRYK